MFRRGLSREKHEKTFLSETTRARAFIFWYVENVRVWLGEGVGSCYALKGYYGRDQLDCPPLNCLNHYLPLNKTAIHNTGERFRATMVLLFKKAKGILQSPLSIRSFVRYAISS